MKSRKRAPGPSNAAIVRNWRLLLSGDNWPIAQELWRLLEFFDFLESNAPRDVEQAVRNIVGKLVREGSLRGGFWLAMDARGGIGADLPGFFAAKQASLPCDPKNQN